MTKDDMQCRCCGATFSVVPVSEPINYCYDCAQDLVPKLLEVCKALPLDCDFTDASDFKDNASRFMRAMDLARAAIAKAEGRTP